MVDTAATLQKFQSALQSGSIQPTNCQAFPELSVLLDEAEGKPSYTYALIVDGITQGITIFVLVAPIGQTPCFHIGYAVDPSLRGRGIGGRIVDMSLKELEHGLRRHASAAYCIEAVVGIGNSASNRLARKYISSNPTQIVCDYSGEDALHYLKRYE
jgi:RimJ/RimL family protein N-acetyltransferase